MTVVAVAGGTGKLGRTISEALVATKAFTVLVLSRKTNDDLEKELGARIVAVDYNDTDAVVSALEANNIQVLISVLDAMAGVEPELSLIKAADRSTTTKRYISNIWGVRYTEEIAKFFPIAQQKRTALQALESTSLEWTAVLNGFFADYYVAPHVKTYQPPMAFVIDMANNAAAIPGSGDVPVVFTFTPDIARFVAALLTLPKWDQESYIIGDKLTWNQFVAIAEEAKGVKFDISNDSVEKLEGGAVTELPSHRDMYQFYPKPMMQGLFAIFGIMFTQGMLDLKPERSLNDAFPDIKPRGIKSLVDEAWKGK